MATQERHLYLDLAKVSSILVAYFGHVFLYQEPGSAISKSLLIFTPSAAMSLLALVYALLITEASTKSYETFLTKRFIRIFIPMLTCLFVSFLLSRINNNWGFDANHLALNAVGFNLFFDLFHIDNDSGVGYGLWFVTAILLMLLTLPIQKALFKHKNVHLHLILSFSLIFIMSLIITGSVAYSAVFFGFTLGVYLVVRDYFKALQRVHSLFLSSVALLLLLINAIASSNDTRWLQNITSPFFALVILLLLKKIQHLIPKFLSIPIILFSMVSYEFYMLQFSFINSPLERVFGIYGLSGNLIAGVLLLLPSSVFVFILCRFLLSSVNRYLNV